jgi:hypothetical protein
VATPRQALRDRLTHPLVLAVLAVAAFRAVAVFVMTQPGYTDAYYYFAAAQRLASGQGLSVDFVWNFLEAPGFAPLPIPSHRFWMPLASAIEAVGIVSFGPLLGAFRGAQVATLLVALLIPVVTYIAARRLGLSAGGSALAAFVAGLGGAYAPAWSSLDNFAAVAVLGTLVLLGLDGVAAGRPRDVVLTGLSLGGLVLARADGALYALAPLLLLTRAPLSAFSAVTLGALVALPWYVRNFALGFPEGQFARTALLVRYEDFWRLEPPGLARYVAAPVDALTTKLGALAANAVWAGDGPGAFALATLLVLGPLALWWSLRGDSILARSWLVVTLALYLTHSLVFTAHSTRGAFPHSLAGVLPVAIALGIAGLGDLTRRVGAVLPRVAFAVLALLAVFASARWMLQWKTDFDVPFSARSALASTGAIETPALVVDAAAWRYVLGGPTLVTPADGLAAARDVARAYGARTLVLEPVHFTAYRQLYEGLNRADWLEFVISENGIAVWRIVAP